MVQRVTGINTLPALLHTIYNATVKPRIVN